VGDPGDAQPTPPGATGFPADPVADGVPAGGGADVTKERPGVPGGPVPDPVEFLRAGCQSHLDEHGVGNVDVTSSIEIVGRRLDIGVRCKLALKGGAGLHLRQVELHSAGLFVADEDGGPPTSVVIEGSQLVGTDGAALAVFLQGKGGHLVVSGSTLDFPTAVALSMAGPKPQGGSAEVTDTTLRSMGEASQGVQVVAPGLRFERLVIHTSAQDGAMVMADHCTRGEVSGAVVVCKS